MTTVILINVTSRFWMLRACFDSLICTFEVSNAKPQKCFDRFELLRCYKCNTSKVSDLTTDFH